MDYNLTQHQFLVASFQKFIAKAEESSYRLCVDSTNRVSILGRAGSLGASRVNLPVEPLEVGVGAGCFGAGFTNRTPT